MRIFVAVPVPADVADVLTHLERPSVEGVRWTTPEQWHVTMVFLGEVPDPGPVLEALRAVSGLVTDELEADLGPATAWFPGRRVLYAPVRRVDSLAAAVVRSLEGVADIGSDTGSDTGSGSGSGAAGPDGDRGRFAGHVTLARAKGRRPGPGRLAGARVSATWPVDSVSLVASTLGAGGARYETLGSVCLLPSHGGKVAG